MEGGFQWKLTTARKNSIQIESQAAVEDTILPFASPNFIGRAVSRYGRSVDGIRYSVFLFLLALTIQFPALVLIPALLC